jgi:hypothetical protein
MMDADTWSDPDGEDAIARLGPEDVDRLDLGIPIHASHHLGRRPSGDAIESTCFHGSIVQVEVWFKSMAGTLSALLTHPWAP